MTRAALETRDDRELMRLQRRASRIDLLILDELSERRKQGSARGLVVAGPPWP